MHQQRGFTYLGVLLAIALLGIGIAAASEVWSTTARRQRMEQLEWVGQQYVQAIGSYRESSPGGAKAYPRSLDELLTDRRVPYVRRHLRQLYANPLSGKLDWELIQAADQGIVGVRTPIAGLSVGHDAHRDFVYLAPTGAKPGAR